MWKVVDSRYEVLEAYAKNTGSEIVLWIDSEDVVVDERVLWKCRFGCPGYGSFLVCPPHAISLDEFDRNLKKYRKILLVRAKPDEINDLVVKVEKKALSLGFHLAFGLKGGPCKLCSECVPPGELCRVPEKARPSMEGVGIDVFSTLQRLGIGCVIEPPESDFSFYGMVLVC